MRECRVLTLDEVKVVEDTQKAADDLLARKEAEK